MIYIGIDPGLDGAVVVMRDNIASFFDTPTVTTKAKGSKKSHRMMDAAECVNILMREVGRNADAMVVLEKVSAAPIEGRRQGTVSMFNFGVGFGMWIGILAGLQIPYTLVHPRTWKSQLMRDQGTEKGASILRAKQLYPQSASCLNLVKHHGRADALLLAHYGRMNLSTIQTPEVELDEVAPLFAPAF